MTTEQLPTSANRPSNIEALKSAVSGPWGVIIAMITALTGLVTAVQAYQDSEQTARVSYETLKTASEKNTADNEVCRKTQLELQTWVQELSDRFERRQVTAEKAITRKVTRAAAPPVIPVVVEPVPKPPVTPVIPDPIPLPEFNALNP